MAQAFLVQKSGGGINQTLPTQVTAFVATADTTPSITLSWTNPTEYFGGVLIVKKIGSAPTSPTDGEKIYSGTAETFTDVDVQFDTEYFYRAFAYNAKKQYQTLYAVASAKPLSGIALSEMAEGVLIKINRAGVATNHYLGKHDYEPELNGYGRQLMIPEDCYDKRLWDSASTDSYDISGIDTWQNSDYKALFSEAVQKMMGETTFYYTSGSDNTTLLTLKRSVFILSLKELGGTYTYSHTAQGSKLPIADSLLIAYLNGEATLQWTRTILGSSNNDRIVCVNTQGSAFNDYSNNTTYASRPCFTLPSTALVNPTPNPDGSYTLIEEVA